MHTGTFRRATATIAVLASAALIAAGCGEDEGGSSSSSGSSGADTAQSEDSGNEAETETTADSGDSAISSPGVDLRLTLDRLLAEHAALAIAGLTKTIAGEADAKAVVGALQANTDELSEAIGSVYGDEAAQAFKSQWEAHIGMFVEYATGVAKKDKAMQAKAKRDLAGYQRSFAKFLSDAAGISAQGAEAALGMHVQQIIRSVDQYAAGDYAASYASAREAYAHMYDTGDALAAAISEQMPDKFGMGSVSTAAADTRVLLGQQLAEHAFLAAVATTESLQGTKDAKAAVAALDQNSVALGNTIESVYGPEAEEAFLSQWRAHIGFFVDYTVGLATKDEAKQQKAGEDLAGYSEGFAQFLATATDGDQEAYQAALEEHVAQLAGSLDAAAAGDLEKAWELEREAYAHMFMTADALTAAIVAQNPEKFEATGSKSGGGSSSEAHDMSGDDM